MTEEALSVGQLFRRSKNALARDFRGNVWVHGEIKAMREMRGSLYLTLVDPGDYADGGDISLDVAAWPKRNAVLQAQLRQSGVTLAAGMMVRVEGNVTISKVGRLQVELAKLDTEALVGRQEAEKRRLLQALATEQLLDANRQLPMPLVPLRIGLVASQDSEGFNDFMGQLERSPFRFAVSFRHSPVQGPTASASLARAVNDLSGEDVDVIAVCRGGGGELDAFDKEAIARAIATATVPVWTGVGHTGDTSIADRVAHSSFITPTECGQALVHAVALYVQRTDEAMARVHRYTERLVDAEARRIKSHGQNLVKSVESALDRAATKLHREGERARRCADRDLALSAQALEGYRKDLARGTKLVTNEAKANLSQSTRRLLRSTQSILVNVERDTKGWRTQVSGFDPVRQLRRGYSLTRNAEGHIVRNIDELQPGSVISTQLAGGSVASTVDSVLLKENANG